MRSWGLAIGFQDQSIYLARLDYLTIVGLTKVVEVEDNKAKLRLMPLESLR